MFNKSVSEHAHQYMDGGYHPQSLAHVLRYPQDYADECGIDAEYGVSTPLPPGARLDGYVERYYTLETLAS